MQTITDPFVGPGAALPSVEGELRQLHQWAAQLGNTGLAPRSR